MCWPIISLPLPSGPGVAVGVHFVRPLPVTPWGNSYILVFTDRFSRHADTYAVSASEFATEDTADILVNHSVPLWVCAVSILPDDGLPFWSKLSLTVNKLLGMRKLATSADHPNGNGDVESINHTMAQIMVMIFIERQNDWDVHLPHVEFTYNNSVSAATGLVPNEMHMNCLPHLPLTIVEHRYARGHQRLTRDRLERCDLAADRQWRAYALVREQHAITVSRVEHRNSRLSNALKQHLTYTVGGWVCSTTPKLPFAGEPNPAPMQRFSRQNYRLTGRVISTFKPSVPRPRTPCRTVAPGRLIASL